MDLNIGATDEFDVPPSTTDPGEVQVGMVRFQLRDGQVIAAATYDAPMWQRPFQISYSGRWFEQNHQTSRGWVYREVASGTMRGDLPDDYRLSNIVPMMTADEDAPVEVPPTEPPPPEPSPVEPAPDAPVEPAPTEPEPGV